MTDSQTLAALLPESTLVIMATVIIVGGAFQRSRVVWWWLSVAAVAVAMVAMWRQGRNSMSASVVGDAIAQGVVIFDQLSQTLRWVSLVLALFYVLALSRDVTESLAGETLGLVLLVFCGMMLVSAAADISLMFLGLEMISIPTYVLLFISPRSTRASEATMKYFFLSVFSSALFLYGLSIVYGLSGSGAIEVIRERLAAPTASNGVLLSVAFVLILAGLGFKIAAVPFHFYAPDVYQGASTMNAGLLAVAPKVGGVVLFVRLLTAIMPGIATIGWQVMLVVALVTMTIGNACALWQKNLRRLLAYSSIAHAGYMTIGFAVGLAAMDGGRSVPNGGFAAAVFYLVVYAIASVGTFSALAYLANYQMAEEVDHLAGVGRSRPYVAGALAVFMFSLSGIPPLAGFWGKLALFTGSLAVGQQATGFFGDRWFMLLTVAGVLNAATAAAYYLRIVGTMYFQNCENAANAAEPPPPVIATASIGSGSAISAVCCAVMVVVLGIFAGPLVDHFSGLDVDVRPAPATAAATSTYDSTVDR
ncbi:MAG: NADH-quinone oxidoreductase subunit N [Pirellulaceae bacterium]|nr:NADH-quinone oxidoreductase subunit N [Planctomycetales bacterium]